jgi:2-polyprenyl-3-methyl-5-hydroxy-6-metoxy-1,4-benzoquinol methylase
MQEEKFNLQDSLYEFPYHYLPHIDQNGVGARCRGLRWGYEYLCYMYHVKKLVERLAPDSFLDLGCGDGRLAGKIEGPSRRVGVDPSEKAIRFAKAFHPEVEFLSERAEALSEEFDVVVAMEVLEHIPDEQVGSFLRTLAQRVAEGGHAVITVPTTVKPLQEKHFRHYDITLFRDHLERSGASLNIKQVEYVYRRSRIVEWYNKLTVNRKWIVDAWLFQRWVWNYVWKHLRRADAQNGCHLVVVLTKE